MEKRGKMHGEIWWSVGVQTCARSETLKYPGRLTTTLPRTLESLCNAGFSEPRLFIDGEDDPKKWEREFCLPITARYPNLRAYGNWILALIELYIREPRADRYVIFQDDILASKNLRQYLEKSPYPTKGYCALYTFPEVQAKAPKTIHGGTIDGWYTYTSHRTGLGGLGLYFSHEALIAMLTNSTSLAHLADRPHDAKRGHTALDGAVHDAMKKAGYGEHVHSPSLLQHQDDGTGRVPSSIGRHVYPPAESWRGESFDCLTLLG